MKYIAEGEAAVEIRFPPHWFQFTPISPNKMQSLMCLRLAPAPPPPNSCFSGDTFAPIRFPERLSSLVCQAGKGKAARDTVTIECTNCTQKGVEKRSNGVSRYTTQKNKRNTTGKLELKKFCPYCNKHTLHAEIKK